MRGEAAPEVGAEHRRHHRAVPAARLAGDRAVLALGERAVAAVDPGHDLVAEVRVVVAGPRRVEELAAAERRPGVDEDDERRRNRVVRRTARPRARRPTAGTRSGSPHVDLAGEALDQVDRRVRLGRVGVVGRRQVDPDRALVRVAERVALQRLADDRRFLEPSPQLDRPGTNRNLLYDARTPWRRQPTRTCSPRSRRTGRSAGA